MEYTFVSRFASFALGFLLAIPWMDATSIALKILSVLIAIVVGYHSIQNNRANKKKAEKEVEYWEQKLGNKIIKDRTKNKN